MIVITLKILKLNSISENYTIVPKKFFQQVLSFYSMGISKNLWKNYSIKINNEKKNNFATVTFYKTNFLYPVILIKYQNKNNQDFIEIQNNEKSEILTDLNQIKFWFSNYFLDKAKI